MAATYKFYYIESGNPNIQNKEYNSSINVTKVSSKFLSDNPNIIKINRIDILSDPEGINTDRSLGYDRSIFRR